MTFPRLRRLALRLLKPKASELTVAYEVPALNRQEMDELLDFSNSDGGQKLLAVLHARAQEQDTEAVAEAAHSLHRCGVAFGYRQALGDVLALIAISSDRSTPEADLTDTDGIQAPPDVETKP